MNLPIAAWSLIQSIQSILSFNFRIKLKQSKKLDWINEITGNSTGIDGLDGFKRNYYNSKLIILNMKQRQTKLQLNV